MPQKWMYFTGGVIVGLVFASQLKRLPLVSKLPSV